MIQYFFINSHKGQKTTLIVFNEMMVLVVTILWINFLFYASFVSTENSEKGLEHRLKFFRLL